MIREAEQSEKSLFNKLAPHPTQSWEWGDFLQRNGKTVIRFAKYENDTLAIPFLIQFKKVPLLPFTIGYLQNCELPDKEVIEYLNRLGRQHKAFFIKVEPRSITHSWANTKGKLSAHPFRHQQPDLPALGLSPAKKAIFDQYSFEIDLTKTEEGLLQNMHPKTRYNIRVAQKHGVTIKEMSDADGVSAFLKLTKETVKRQNFYQHEAPYFKKMWKSLSEDAPTKDRVMHVLAAHHEGQIIAAWVLFVFNNVLYYPYGASLSQFKNVMASNLLCWEAIKFGKKLGCTKFDLWGSLGPTPTGKESWFGFHRFKQGYGGTLTESVGSWDLVLNGLFYQIFYLMEAGRWLLLKMARKGDGEQ